MKRHIFVKSSITVAILITLFAFTSIYQYFNEDLSAFDKARETSTQGLSPELYFQSSLGLTRYKTFGKKEQPTVVLIHSFNGFLESWNPNIKSLVDAGFQVLSYDLWGRGLSSRPRAELSLAVFRDQLHQLMFFLNIKKAHLIGASFGSVIASDYALNHQENIASLSLLGPAGWPKDGDNTTKLLKTPIIPDVVFHYFGEKILKPKVEDYLYYRQENQWAIDYWDEFAQHPGFSRSLLSTLRHSPVRDYTEGWAALGRTNIPTTFIWGKQDISFPYSNVEKATTLVPHANIIAIENAAHWVNIDQAQQVNDALISFLSQ
ncbi:MAG: alpha/beta hydrolase [Pseudomonadales bacterium]|nr:alpha/beta hydrolase [Pseudomonadales bacterium]